MIDVFLDFWSGLLSEATNPQKRVFIGYLASALFIAFLWLFFIEKLKIKDATSLIFSKKIWFSKSSKADFKLLLAFSNLFFSTRYFILMKISNQML